MFQLCFLISHPQKRRLTAEFPCQINMMEQYCHKHCTTVTHGNTVHMSVGCYQAHSQQQAATQICMLMRCGDDQALSCSRRDPARHGAGAGSSVSAPAAGFALSRLIFRWRVAETAKSSLIAPNGDLSLLVKQPRIAHLVVSDSSLHCLLPDCVCLFSLLL